MFVDLDWFQLLLAGVNWVFQLEHGQQCEMSFDGLHSTATVTLTALVSAWNVQ
ncbi:MAG: hypothetical protein AAF393_17935 [Pseudomonadota bacterium]